MIKKILLSFLIISCSSESVQDLKPDENKGDFIENKGLLELSSGVLTFEEKMVGVSKELVLSVTNSGTEIINITDISSNDIGFTTETKSIRLSSNQGIDIHIVFTPSIAKNYFSLLHIQVEGKEDLIVECTGIGTKKIISKYNNNIKELIVPNFNIVGCHERAKIAGFNNYEETKANFKITSSNEPLKQIELGSMPIGKPRF